MGGCLGMFEVFSHKMEEVNFADWDSVEKVEKTGWRWDKAHRTWAVWVLQNKDKGDVIGGADGSRWLHFDAQVRF